jgi:nucleoside 2-deoxyribosyltransferase
MQPKVYIAAALFSQAELAFNAKLLLEIEQFCKCYLPQRDGTLLADAVASGEERGEVAAGVFDADVRAIRNADIVVAVLDGSEIDSGVAFEVGVAWTLQKRVLGLRTDSRRPIAGGINPMVEGACCRITESIEELMGCLRSHVFLEARVGGQSASTVVVL